MKQLNAAVRNLFWKPIGNQRYELVDGDSLYAAMRFYGPCNLDADAVTTSSCWQVRCVQLLQSRFKIFLRENGQDIASFVPLNTEQFQLRFTDGQVYTWEPAPRQTKRWQHPNAWCWSDQFGLKILTITAGTSEWLGAFDHEAEVVVHSSSLSAEHTALLAVIGWYVMLVHYEDEQAVISAVMTAYSMLSF